MNPFSLIAEVVDTTHATVLAGASAVVMAATTWPGIEWFLHHLINWCL